MRYKNHLFLTWPFSYLFRLADYIADVDLDTDKMQNADAAEVILSNSSAVGADKQDLWDIRIIYFLLDRFPMCSD